MGAKNRHYDILISLSNVSPRQNKGELLPNVGLAQLTAVALAILYSVGIVIPAWSRKALQDCHDSTPMDHENGLFPSSFFLVFYHIRKGSTDAGGKLRAPLTVGTRRQTVVVYPGTVCRVIPHFLRGSVLKISKVHFAQVTYNNLPGVWKQ